MIKFQNVAKSIGGRVVLKNVTFEIRDHETVAVLGPSGSGKTTLLRLIAGTLQPDSGTIQVDSPRIGFIFQDHRLSPGAPPRTISPSPEGQPAKRARKRDVERVPGWTVSDSRGSMTITRASSVGG